MTGERARAWKRRPTTLVLSILTLLAGGFICVAGMYVIITLMSARMTVDLSCSEYQSQKHPVDQVLAVPEPFSC
jgi:hypothetical protein